MKSDGVTPGVTSLGDTVVEKQDAAGETVKQSLEPGMRLLGP